MSRTRAPDLERLARTLAELSYEDRRRVLAEARRLEWAHFEEVRRMQRSDPADARVRTRAERALDEVDAALGTHH